MLSVNVVVATPENSPVAVTLYCATYHSAMLNRSTMSPFSSAVTTASYWNRSSATPSSTTDSATFSPGCHPLPVTVTSSPGA